MSLFIRVHFCWSVPLGIFDAGQILCLLAAQAAAIAFLAGRQMGAHRRARRVGVAGRDRLQDGQVLALQPSWYSRVRTLSVPQGEATSQGMVRRAERIENLDIERIVGRDGYRPMEGEVRLAGRLRRRSSRSNSKNASWIAASWALLRRSAARPALSISMPMRTSSTLIACEILLPISRLIEPKAQRRVVADENAGALARFDQAVGGERGDRLANDRAADAERLRQLAFGRQLLPRHDLAADRPAAQRRRPRARKAWACARCLDGQRSSPPCRLLFENARQPQRDAPGCR